MAAGFASHQACSGKGAHYTRKDGTESWLEDTCTGGRSVEGRRGRGGQWRKPGAGGRGGAVGAETAFVGTEEEFSGEGDGWVDGGSVPVVEKRRLTREFVYSQRREVEGDMLRCGLSKSTEAAFTCQGMAQRADGKHRTRARTPRPWGELAARSASARSQEVTRRAQLCAGPAVSSRIRCTHRHRCGNGGVQFQTVFIAQSVVLESHRT